MFKKYDEKIRSILSNIDSDNNWKYILENHQRMILHIQNERLIHLIVTVFVGIIMTLGSYLTIVTERVELIYFCFPLLILFIAYLLHSRFLENTTQSWYLIEDQIIEIIKPINF